ARDKPGHDDETHCLSFVMPALVAGIHVFTTLQKAKTWMAGTSPAMTVGRIVSICHARLYAGHPRLTALCPLASLKWTMR
ncbi:MAG: hypothetical protein WB525_16645, partial [Pseudolabrys sp.]